MRLKQARIKRGITLDILAEQTRINKIYLKALEECRIEAIPVAPIYIKQYIRQYAKAVGLAEKELLRGFGFENQWQSKAHTKQTKPHPSPIPTNRSFLNIPKLARAMALTGITGAFVIVMVLQLLHFLEPPTLTVVNPPDGFVTSESVIAIQGYTEKEVTININGTPIQNDEAGFFQTKIPLQKGVNTIAIQATKRSGKQATDVRTVVRENSDSKISLK